MSVINKGSIVTTNNGVKMLIYNVLSKDLFAGFILDSENKKIKDGKSISGSQYYKKGIISFVNIKEVWTTNHINNIIKCK